MLNSKLANTGTVLGATVNDPKIFNGSNNDGDEYNRLESFLTQLNMVFKLQPSRFPNDETKVIYAASFMDQIAFEWVQPYINAVGTSSGNDSNSRTDYIINLH